MRVPISVRGPADNAWGNDRSRRAHYTRSCSVGRTDNAVLVLNLVRGRRMVPNGRRLRLLHLGAVRVDLLGALRMCVVRMNLMHLVGVSVHGRVRVRVAQQHGRADRQLWCRIGERIWR
jgi:hypothetical protein